MSIKLPWSFLPVLCWFSLGFVKTENVQECGGILTATKGILQTPGFPNEFRVPISCTWVIDASEITNPNTSIIIYLTQLFVFEGLSFEEYETYDQSYNILGKRVHTVLETNISKVKWVGTDQNVLVVNFHLQSIENTHLRILDYFLDVYGFNLTYEITTEEIRSDSCTMADCGFTGVCYDDFENFYCQCFSGYSGPACSNGPHSLCPEDEKVCQNGGHCRHVGTTLVECDCVDDYIGDHCQKQMGFFSKDECNGKNVGHDCNNCSNNIIRSNSFFTDGNELTTTLRLMQGPNLRKEDFQLLVNQQILSSKLGISHIDRVRVSYLKYYEWGTEATIHFIGLKKDRKRIESLINKWIHAGRIGNVTLIDKNVLIRNDSRLFIKSISINQLGLIREGDQFILSCVAQGTPSINFRWLKDGLPINVSKLLSNKWFRLIQDTQVKNQYTALLGIENASYFDAGVFVCEAEDLGVRQCLSRTVEVRNPPSVKIEPMSLTVQKGENFTIKCICLSNKNNEYKFTYSWTKNKELLPIKTEMEKYEILYPAGSILQVSKIDKPSTYSCLVQDEVFSTEVSIQVDVIDRSLVNTCRGEKHINILWPETAPGTMSIQECPKGFVGTVRRWCVLHDFEQSLWQLPDFSLCTADALINIKNDLERSRLGYGHVQELEILKGYQNYLKNRPGLLLPGEGARILTLLNEVVSYINTLNDFSAIQSVTTVVFDVISDVMKSTNSLVNQMQVTLLQQTVQKQVQFVKEILNSTSNYHQLFSSLDISLSAVQNEFPKVPIEKTKYPSWYRYELQIAPNGPHEISYMNESLQLACVVYKNLTSFLPTRSAIRLRDGSEMEYEIISNVAAVWLIKNGQTVTDYYTFSFDMIFYHPMINTTMSKWSVNCSSATYASYGYNWDIAGCLTELINATFTRCVCQKSGSFAVLITTIPLTLVKQEHTAFQFFVLAGCCCCLLFCAISGIILIGHWILQKSSLAFLKVQFCLVLGGAMAIFVVALSVDVPHESYSYINTFLEILLLIALSSHISKCLIVYTEFVQLSKAQNLSKTVVAISTGVPIITVFASHLTHRTMGKRQSSWWLINGSVSFNIFFAVFLLMIFLYNIMYLMVVEKLTHSENKHSALVLQRKKLLRRSFCIFWSTVMMICSSVMYINMRESEIWNYNFAFTNGLLSLIMFTCYIIKPETPLMEDCVQILHWSPSNKNQVPSPDGTSSNTASLQAISNKNSSTLILSDLQNIPTSAKIIPNTDNPQNVKKSSKEPKTQQHQQESHPSADLQNYMYSPDIVATRVHVELDLVTPIMHDSSCDRTKIPPDENPIILCNIAVNSRYALNQNAFVQYPEQKAAADSYENASKAHYLKCERFQPELLETVPEEENFKNDTGSLEYRQTSVSEAVSKTNDSLDGMLDKISHDLDYLLNRTKSPSKSANKEDIDIVSDDNDQQSHKF